MVKKKYLDVSLYSLLQLNDKTCAELLSNTLLAHHLALQIY